MGSTSAEIVFSLYPDSNKLGDQKAASFCYANGPIKVPGPWKRGRPRGSRNNNKIRLDSEIRNEPRKLCAEFINISSKSKSIDSASRAIIRRHARMLVRCRHKEHQYESTTHFNMMENREIVQAEQISVIRALTKPNLHQVPGVDPFNRSPIKLEPYMHDLLLYFTTTLWKHFYSLEKLVGFNPIAEYWLPLAFQDPALINTFIGCAEVYVSGYNTITDGLRGLKHMHAAVSLVNERLMTHKNIISGGTLSIIAGMALLEKGSGRHDHWHIHMRGLKQLVDSRGGLESLHLEPMVLNKIYRADLYGSLDAAESPYFTPYLSLTEFSPETPFQSEGFNALRKATRLDNILLYCLHQLEEAMPFWLDIYESSSGYQNDRFSDHVTHKRPPTPTEVARLRHLLTNIQYALVSTNFQQMFGNTEEGLTLEFCRITLILYTLTILNERPASGAVGQRIGNAFRRVLTELVFPSHSNSPDSEVISWMLPLPTDFHLWAILLAVSVMMTKESDTKDWLILSFVELTLSKYDYLDDWYDLRSRLSQYLWVPSIHGPTLQWLWLKIEVRRKLE